MLEFLISTGLEESDIRCIKNLFWKPIYNFQVAAELTDNIPISRGARQACILSTVSVYIRRKYLEYTIGLDGITEVSSCTYVN